MRLERVLRAVYNEPWLLPGWYHANVRRLVDMKLSMSAQDFSMRQREGETISGDKVLLPSMQENTRTDILTVAGDAMHKASSLNETLQPYMGPVSANEYSPALAA
jgi:hypothetical protein